MTDFTTKDGVPCNPYLCMDDIVWTDEAKTEKFTGFENSYWENSLVRYVVPYVDGDIHGTECSYFENGAQEHEATWVNGKKEGLDITYYGDGKIEKMSEWKNNKMDGKCETFYTNGKIRTLSFYKNGLHEGPTTWFGFAIGRVYKKSWYFEGKEVSNEEEYRLKVMTRDANLELG